MPLFPPCFTEDGLPADDGDNNDDDDDGDDDDDDDGNEEDDDDARARITAFHGTADLLAAAISNSRARSSLGPPLAVNPGLPNISAAETLLIPASLSEFNRLAPPFGTGGGFLLLPRWLLLANAKLLICLSLIDSISTLDQDKIP